MNPNINPHYKNLGSASVESTQLFSVCDLECYNQTEIYFLNEEIKRDKIPKIIVNAILLNTASDEERKFLCEYSFDDNSFDHEKPEVICEYAKFISMDINGVIIKCSDLPKNIIEKIENYALKYANDNDLEKELFND